MELSSLSVREVPMLFGVKTEHFLEDDIAAFAKRALEHCRRLQDRGADLVKAVQLNHISHGVFNMKKGLHGLGKQIVDALDTTDRSWPSSE